MSDDTRVLRAIDANNNRLSEALRTAEDVVRFVLGDRFLTQQIKDLRHQANALVLAAVSRERLLNARDTLHDAGTETKAIDESIRSDLGAVLSANLQRAQQSLRSLEEHFKLLCPQTAAHFEQLRYKSYTIDKALTCGSLGREVLQHVVVYGLVEACEHESHFTRRIEALVESGIDAIQLRDKVLSDRELLSRARRLVDVTKKSDVLTFINDRPDIARLAKATGVHLGQEDLPIHEARHILDPDQLVGVSTHDWSQVQAAVLAGANYLGIGPVFPSPTKSFERFLDDSLLQDVFREVSLPVFAIGGISVENVAKIGALGGRRVAVSGVLADDSPDLGCVIGQLRQGLPPMP